MEDRPVLITPEYLSVNGLALYNGGSGLTQPMPTRCLLPFTNIFQNNCANKACVFNIYP